MKIPTAGIVFGLSVLALDARVLPQQGSPPADAACSVAAVQAKAPGDTTITAAAWVEATPTAPRHCLVDGHVQVPGNTVRFRVGLPASWNGKFYFQGVGGLAGTIGGLTTGLARGYASASTDTGHDAADPTWGSQPRQGDRLRPPRHARDRGGGQGADRRLLRPAGGARLLQRLLERRPAGDDGSAALSRPTSTA